MALASIRVNGVQARLVAPVWHGWSGSLSATHARGDFQPSVHGVGLFLGEHRGETAECLVRL